MYYITIEGERTQNKVKECKRRRMQKKVKEVKNSEAKVMNIKARCWGSGTIGRVT